MHKDCFFTAASVLMELVLTESRIAPVNDTFFGLSQEFWCTNGGPYKQGGAGVSGSQWNMSKLWVTGSFIF